MSQRLGDLLVKEKIITPEQLDQAIKKQKEENCRLGTALVKLGIMSDEDVTNFLSKQYGVPAINLSYFEIDPAVVKLVPVDTTYWTNWPTAKNNYMQPFMWWSSAHMMWSQLQPKS